jgi:HEAT repeat protein
MSEHPILDAVEEVFSGTEPEGDRTSARPLVEPTSTPPPVAPPSAPPPSATSDPMSSMTTDERRRALDRILRAGVTAAEAELMARVLVSDPDPELRLIAAEALTAAPLTPPASLVEQALRDPSDPVRAAAVRLAARTAAAISSGLISLAADRGWPATQEAALSVLPDLIRAGEDALPAIDLERLVVHIAALDPPPLPPERTALGAIARAIGPERLTGELGGPEHRRLGAARLLLAEGSSASLQAVAQLAGDPSEGLRRLAEIADSALWTEGDGSTEQALEPAPQVVSIEDDEPGLDRLLDALAHALDDPVEHVATRARDALRELPREQVTAWCSRTLSKGSPADVLVAAAVIRELGARDLAGLLVERASALPPQEQGPLIRSLEAIGLDSETLAGLPASVDPMYREAAVHLVWRLGGRSILPHLVALLEDSSGAVRMAVLQVFADSEDPAALRLAGELLQSDSSAAVRASAIHILARLSGRGATRWFELAMGDADPDVRATAVEALPLGSAGHPVPEVASLLLRALRDDDESVARAAAGRLATLASVDPSTTWTAVAGSGTRLRQEIIRSVEREGPGALAALALSNMGASAPSERALAVELAARAGTPECMAAVVAALEDPNPIVRRAAAAAMSTIGTSVAVGALSRCLSDPHVEVRVEAVRSLGLIDDDGVPPSLVRALQDPEVRVRSEAGDALLRWRSPTVARQLVAALASPDLRRPLMDVLQRMGLVTVEPLTEAAVAGDPVVGPMAGTLLRRITGPARFVSELGSTDPRARLRAVEVLGAMRGAEAVDALIGMLGDPEVHIRTRAATLIGSLGDPRAHRALRRTFLSDPVVEVAAAAEAALRSLGTLPEEIAPEASHEGPDSGSDPGEN